MTDCAIPKQIWKVVCMNQVPSSKSESKSPRTAGFEPKSYFWNTLISPYILVCGEKIPELNLNQFCKKDTYFINANDK